MKKLDFNRDNHPEREDDEVFITNTSDEVDYIFSETGRSGYDAIGWNTKRKGVIAYDIHGVALGGRWPNSFPVFVKQNEIASSEDGKKILERLLPQK
ncbi:MAG TPA: hypothetical protein VL576_02520 [Candidatus Paceibacterota bacterium]|jgi:hypothetical protein|nr:hypothetical protein [Candidatus Paceibacterota bacterium]